MVVDIGFTGSGNDDASGRFPILQPGYKGENPKRLLH